MTYPMLYEDRVRKSVMVSWERLLQLALFVPHLIPEEAPLGHLAVYLHHNHYYNFLVPA